MGSNAVGGEGEAVQILEKWLAARDGKTFNDDEPKDSDYLDAARQSAQQYAAARNHGTRLLRPLDSDDERVVEARRDALEYLERKRKSVIKK